MKINLSFPNFDAEKQILSQNFVTKKLNPIISGDDIIQIQNFIEKNIHVDDKIIDYVLRILQALRNLTKEDTIFGTQLPLLQYGPSTRAGMALIRTAKVKATLNNRDFVLPEDIKSLAKNILQHRISLSYEAESENISVENILEKVLDSVTILNPDQFPHK